MARTKRLRRVLILCTHCLRNLTYYRLGWFNNRPAFDGDLMRTVNGNFLDICILEWCKLFAEPRGRHCWRRAVSDASEFETGLLNSMACTEEEFANFVEQVRTYRDRFVAHLDDDEKMRFPKLDLVLQSTIYLYRHVVAHEFDVLPDDVPPSLNKLVASWQTEAITMYRNAKLH